MLLQGILLAMSAYVDGSVVLHFSALKSKTKSTLLVVHVRPTGVTINLLCNIVSYTTSSRHIATSSRHRHLEAPLLSDACTVAANAEGTRLDST